MERSAPILRIEKISLDDGPGLRTVVFFKGCPLRCAWCSTPESMSAFKERYYQTEKCALCARCVQACPSQALSVPAGGDRLVWDRTKCKSCFRCANVCPARATGVYGIDMTVKEVMRHILKDELFFYHSGGGVTLSGGSVMCHPEFAGELLTECKHSAINTSAELDMYGDYAKIAMLFPLLDSAFVDLKMMDAEMHRKWTGKENEPILSNIRMAAAEFGNVPIHARVPLIWGINDSADNLQKAAEFCASLSNCISLEFLPYHRLGRQTYQYLSREYMLSDLPTMEFQEAQTRISCLIGKKWPFTIKISGKTVE